VIIDCHGHYTTAPPSLLAWRERQISLFDESGARLDPGDLVIHDDEIRESIQAQLELQRERDTDVTLLSPIAGYMAHHHGDLDTSDTWSRVANDLIHRVCTLFPRNFIGVCQLPQSPGAPVDRCVDELRRCVMDLGFVGCNLNPDPSDGYWKAVSLSDRSYYPLYEAMVELDVPAMVHVSMSCNPSVQGTCAHYLNGDTTAFVQLVTSYVFRDFPDLKFIIPHGGGSVPYHWGRYRGFLQDLGLGPLDEAALGNIFFDSCVYWQPGLELLTQTIPAANVLYASEMIGAVRGIDPGNGRRYDDTKFLLDSISSISASDRQRILGDNALRVYGRLSSVLQERGLLAEAGEA
jgi:4-oxalmesaconate hydratase